MVVFNLEYPHGGLAYARLVIYSLTIGGEVPVCDINNSFPASHTPVRQVRMRGGDKTRGSMISHWLPQHCGEHLDADSSDELPARCVLDHPLSYLGIMQSIFR